MITYNTATNPVATQDNNESDKSREVKHTIHFGEKSFTVNEWLYDYFNKVKEKPRLYTQLFNILSGVKK